MSCTTGAGVRYARAGRGFFERHGTDAMQDKALYCKQYQCKAFNRANMVDWPTRSQYATNCANQANRCRATSMIEVSANERN
jgi:hypothetical protein